MPWKVSINSYFLSLKTIKNLFYADAPDSTNPHIWRGKTGKRALAYKLKKNAGARRYLRHRGKNWIWRGGGTLIICGLESKQSFSRLIELEVNACFHNKYSSEVNARFSAIFSSEVNERFPTKFSSEVNACFLPNSVQLWTHVFLPNRIQKRTHVFLPNSVQKKTHDFLSKWPYFFWDKLHALQ